MRSNPFNFTGPAVGERFLGRRNRVEGIADDLADWGGASHAIIGGLHMGKSSLLRAVEAELRGRLEGTTLTDTRALPVYVSFHAMAAVESEQEVLGFFLLRLYQTLSGHSSPAPLKLEQDTLNRLKSLAHAGQSPVTLQTLEAAVGEIVAQLDPLLGPLRIVFLIESVENAAGASWIDYLFDNLNALVHDGELRNHVRVVLTGAERLLAIKQRGSPLLSRLRLHFLEPLPEEDVRSLLALAPEVPDEARSEIMSVAGGHPFVLQHIMHFLWEGGAEHATVERVAVEAQRFIDDRSNDLEHWWSAVGGDGHRVYCLLRRAEGWLPRNEIIKSLGAGAEPALKQLLYYGLIRHDGSFKNYRIYGRILSDWCEGRCAALMQSPESKSYAAGPPVAASRNGADETAHHSSLTAKLPDAAAAVEGRRDNRLLTAPVGGGRDTSAGGKPTGEERSNFFISYNKADKGWAEWIAWLLEEEGYSVLLQAWDFRPGENFVLEMQRAVVACEKTIVVLSDNYLEAFYTQPEWAAAFVSDPQGRGQKLIPIRVAECEPKGMLAPLIYVDLVGLSKSAARAAVLDAFRPRAKPAEAPVYPGGEKVGDEKERRSVPYPGETGAAESPVVQEVPEQHETPSEPAGDADATTSHDTPSGVLHRLMRPFVWMRAYLDKKLGRNPLIRRRRFPRRLTTWKMERVKLVFDKKLKRAVVEFSIDNPDIEVWCNNLPVTPPVFKFEFPKDKFVQNFQLRLKKIKATSTQPIGLICSVGKAEVPPREVHAVRLRRRKMFPKSVTSILDIFPWLIEQFIYARWYLKYPALLLVVVLCYNVIPVLFPSQVQSVMHQVEAVLIGAKIWPERKDTLEEKFLRGGDGKWTKEAQWEYPAGKWRVIEERVKPDDAGDGEGGAAGERPTSEEGALRMEGSGIALYKGRDEENDGGSFYDFELEFGVLLPSRGEGKVGWVVRADRHEQSWYEFELVQKKKMFQLKGYSYSPDAGRRPLKGSDEEFEIPECCRPWDYIVVRGVIKEYEFTHWVAIENPDEEEPLRDELGSEHPPGRRTFKAERKWFRSRHRYGTFGLRGSDEGDEAEILYWQVRPLTKTESTARSQ